LPVTISFHWLEVSFGLLLQNFDHGVLLRRSAARECGGATFGAGPTILSVNSGGGLSVHRFARPPLPAAA